jgi:8-amino-7-oxononanoate synthase
VTRESEFAEPLERVGAATVLYRGRKLSYFGGCDYLGLSWHPRILKAITESLKARGLSVSASRKTTGNHPLYAEVEQKLAAHFELESALLVPTGYQTNLALAQALKGAFDTVLIDEHAHPSLMEAAAMLGAACRSFKHLDSKNMAGKTKNSRRIAILTDGIFALTGHTAPLPEYRKLAPKALLWVDDSHAAGLMNRGQGTVQTLGIEGRVIQTTTLSKTFGLYGGVILGERKVIQLVVAKSALLTGSTPLPLPWVTAIPEALDLAGRSELREKLERNIAAFEASAGLGEGHGSPIFAFSYPSKMAERLRKELLGRGIFPSLIRYGGKAPVFRFALSSAHSLSQIKLLGQTLRKIG